MTKSQPQKSVGDEKVFAAIRDMIDWATNRIQGQRRQSFHFEVKIVANGRSMSTPTADYIDVGVVITWVSSSGGH